MLIHELKATKKGTHRVGRGGKRGTFSGRGTKGQKARSGRRMRPELRDILKKIPKLRGRGKHSLKPFQIKPLVINVRDLERLFTAGETVSLQTLKEKGALDFTLSKPRGVKILGTGELKKKLTIEGCEVSESAKAKIEKAGGAVSSKKTAAQK
jgi:large subunit ribosomal protein L15